MVDMVSRLAHWPVNRDGRPIVGTATMGPHVDLPENTMAGKPERSR
jgi:hypothetical protein